MSSLVLKRRGLGQGRGGHGLLVFLLGEHRDPPTPVFMVVSLVGGVCNNGLKPKQRLPEELQLGPTRTTPTGLPGAFKFSTPRPGGCGPPPLEVFAGVPRAFIFHWRGWVCV